MTQLKEVLAEYLKQHPIDFGMSDADTILDFLYTAYSEAHESDPPEIRSLFEQLGEYLEALPTETNNAMFFLIVQLCTEHDRMAFEGGIRWGFQLHSELNEMEDL